MIFKKYILKSWFKKQQGFLKTEQESGRKPSHGGLVVIAPFVGNADCRVLWMLVVEFQVDVETNPMRDSS